ncbi:hypothetical protein QBC37DRAFT_73635 [Rhypophila decipiens]|uniref:Uncharacterized protein n=1 Tax=Rhypophila decipiens TaxID=261697 RepID=A0AAN6YJZ1_9PEZI|nr:hypothetical protein QBC37DRAFT_73635 [Rhypophila decipiens]
MAAQRETLSVKKPRGRPKRVKRLEPKNFTIHIQPKLHPDEVAHLHANYQSQDLPDLPVIADSDRVSEMPNPRRRRPYEVLLNRQREEIRPFCASMEDPDRNERVWVQFPRVLLSAEVERSYMSEERLGQLNILYTPWPDVYKYSTRFGLMEALGYAEIFVTTESDSWHKVFRITVLVLPDKPGPGGVDFIIGKLDLNRAYRGKWRPNWSEGQYAQHGTGHGHDTLIENNNLVASEYRGPLFPPTGR